MSVTRTTCIIRPACYGDGFDEGRKAEKLAIARSLIGLLSTEVIAEKTGLSREAIEGLAGKPASD